MKRNLDIIKSYQKEINLNTKVVSSKKKYNRKRAKLCKNEIFKKLLRDFSL